MQRPPKGPRSTKATSRRRRAPCERRRNRPTPPRRRPDRDDAAPLLGAPTSGRPSAETMRRFDESEVPPECTRIECVRAWLPKKRTPRTRSPSVMPVAQKITSLLLRGRRVRGRGRGRRNPSLRRALASSSLRGLRRPMKPPPRHFIAAAASTPSGAPPVPIATWMPVDSIAVAMQASTSPSEISLMRAPAARTSR